MVKLLLVRHGLSVTNKAKKFTGQLDVPLDKVGEEQAVQVSDYLFKNYKIDKICSSDSQRAVNTIKPLADSLGMTIETSRKLRELDVGSWEGMNFEDVEQKFPESYALYKANPGRSKCDGGESFEDLLNRSLAEVNRIVFENEGKTVVIATHGGVIRLLRNKWLGRTLDDVGSLEHVSNASLTSVTYENGEFHIDFAGYCDYLSEKTGAIKLF